MGPGAPNNMLCSDNLTAKIWLSWPCLGCVSLHLGNCLSSFGVLLSSIFIQWTLYITLRCYMMKRIKNVLNKKMKVYVLIYCSVLYDYVRIGVSLTLANTNPRQTITLANSNPITRQIITLLWLATTFRLGSVRGSAPGGKGLCSVIMSGS